MPTTSPEAPYISLVVTARNDNHGVNMLGRMQAFLDSWLGQAKRLQLPSEIVIVEWNPPEGRPPLKDELQWPADTSPCAVRFVEVPREVHQSIPNARAIPLHQMIAKNAGIRRARGEFVMATNLDIIFSPQLMEFLAGRNLEHRAFYRMDRFDVASEIPPHGNLEQLLAFCDSHILRVCAREGVWDTNGGGRLRLVESDDIVSADCGIRLGAGWFGIERPEGVPQRYVEPEAGIHFEHPVPAGRRLILDVEPGPSARENWIELLVRDANHTEMASAIVDGRCELRLNVPDPLVGPIHLGTRNGGIAILQDPRILDLRVFGLRWEETVADDQAVAPRAALPGWRLDRISRKPGVDWPARGLTQSTHARSMRSPVYLHTNGCGDFTMLSRKDWFALRAYPEFPVWPQHIDSFLCYAAYHAGFREVILRDPMRIFHIQHEAASGATPDGEAELKRRVAARGVTFIDYPTLLGYFHHMRRFNVPLIFSGENWGLADHELAETTL